MARGVYGLLTSPNMELNEENNDLSCADKANDYLGKCELSSSQLFARSREYERRCNHYQAPDLLQFLLYRYSVPRVDDIGHDGRLSDISQAL